MKNLDYLALKNKYLESWSNFSKRCLVSQPKDTKQNIHARYWSNPNAKQIHPSLAMTAAIGI